MRNCVDEGILQAWFDGELNADRAASVATHLSGCAECAAMARSVEAENLMLAEGLSHEFAAAVPTERLRQRVEVAVAELQRPNRPRPSESRWQAIAAFFSFRPLAYATVALMILLAGVMGILYLRSHKQTAPPQIAQNPLEAPAPSREPQSPKTAPAPAKTPELVAVVKKQKAARRPRAVEPDATSINWQEHQYESAIAKLNEALKTQPPMRPALQVDYEYNMAVIDSAIASTRDAARKNPKDPLASQFMLAAYQSKVDFMNQIADARGLGR
ncbi:MAG TPA: zf-HC2 domain-containing protein [Pyrinomonadaceae bacterium]|nr:zf-HC2 domain-containing protein [Pyrinomonadaceae bacterium]